MKAKQQVMMANLHMKSPILHRYRFSISSALCWFSTFETYSKAFW